MATRGPKPSKAAKRRPVGRKIHVPTPPTYLSAPARSEYRRLVRVLLERGTLERTDQRLIELAATAYADLREARAQIDNEGMVLKASTNGAPYAHPLLKAANELRNRLMRLYREFGLTPSTHKHGGKPAVSSPDEWAGMLDIFTG